MSKTLDSQCNARVKREGGGVLGPAAGGVPGQAAAQ